MILVQLGEDCREDIKHVKYSIGFLTQDDSSLEENESWVNRKQHNQLEFRNFKWDTSYNYRTIFIGD